MDCFEEHNDIECFVFNDVDINENEEVEFITFYDICGERFNSLIVKGGKFYICIRVNTFGSSFYGNFIFNGKGLINLDPSNLMIKEIDPLLFVVNFIYQTTYNVDTCLFRKIQRTICRWIWHRCYISIKKHFL
jgi:hypothetical protein